MRRLLSIALALLPLTVPMPIAAQQWSAAQHEVWTAVERGWAALRAEDVDGFMDTIHPRFLGWNMSRERPYDAAAERSGTEAFLAAYDWESYHIEPVAIEVSGDVAVAHYRYTEVVRAAGGGEPHGETGRATQVLKREEGRWRTFTIMSGPVPPT